MNGFWLVSYIILWLLVMGLGMVILALSREVEALHTRLNSLYRFLDGTNIRGDGRGPSQDIPQAIPEGAIAQPSNE